MTGAATVAQASRDSAGRYLYADFCNGRIWGAKIVPGTGWRNVLLLDSALQISTFGEDQEGEMYIGDHLNGVIFRITGFVP